MKKNLRNILALSLGLITTVAFAQDWNVDSRTRIDMGGDYDKMETAQRATLGATWGGSNWGIHASTVVNYDLSATDANGNLIPARLGVYEAYASTDLMGYASLTMGRQALNYGSGNLIGSNEWAADRNTRDGMTFGLNLDMADVTVGHFSRMSGDSLTNGGSGFYVNASKAEGDWTANLLYGSQSATIADVDGDDLTYMGLDLSYTMMDGALGLNVSYNTVEDGVMEDMDMTSIGATYNVNDDMSISATQTTYGKGGFLLKGGNLGLHGTDANGTVYDSWISNGNMGYLAAEQQNLSLGGSYAMGAFNFDVTMHTVTSDAVGGEEYERNAMEVALGYTISDNAGLAVNYANDDNGTENDTKYMWLTLTVNP